MDENQLREIAAQLSCPSGESGAKTAEFMNQGNAFLTARSIEMLAPKSGEFIAEAGPGNGVLSIPIAKAIGLSGHYFGLEQSKDMAEQASIRLKQANLAPVTIHTGDCINAPIEENTIDGFLAVNVLYFIDNIHVLFRNASRWLKPGSRAVFGLRSEHSLRSFPFTRFGFRIRTLEDITEALQVSGFGNVETECHDEGLEIIGGAEVHIDALIVKAIKI